MYFLKLSTINCHKNKTINFVTDNTDKTISKWTLLDHTQKNRETLQLITLSCCGQFSIPDINYDISKLFWDKKEALTVAYTMSLHKSDSSVLDCGFNTLTFNYKKGKVSLSENDLPSELSGKEKSFKRTIHGQNRTIFSLAYGTSLQYHIGSDDFTFSDPAFRASRYNNLFDNTAKITDPVAFLERLHYKAVRCGRYPAKQTLKSLSILLEKYLAIDTSQWQQKKVCFQDVWDKLTLEKQSSLLPILDISRHIIDAFPQSGTPLQEPGVVVFVLANRHSINANLNNSEHKQSFISWIQLMDELFPKIQFIMTLEKSFIASFPDKVKQKTLSLAKLIKKTINHKRKITTHLAPGTIQLIQIDGRLPNLALMKLSSFYKSQGYKIKLSKGLEKYTGAEAVFGSSIFSFPNSTRKLKNLKKFYGNSLTLGGSGIDLKLRLADSIENSDIDYELYPELKDRALGFVTRGCPYRCPFCLVPEKEGNIRQVCDFDQLLKGRRKLILLDDNILAHPKKGELLEEMAQRNLAVNFTQTLDIRLLNKELVSILKRIYYANTIFSRKVIHFSLNNLSGLSKIEKNYRLFDFTHKDNVEFVCMYGYDTTLREDVERFRFIRSLPGAYVFVQEYKPILNAPPKPKVDFFDADADQLIKQLISIEFRQNMKSMEKYYRWLSEQYFLKFGQIHVQLVDTIFRFNRREQKGYYIATLSTSLSEIIT